MVIKDKNGKIIAKSTLYVNRKQGYGVFNKVKISSSIKNPKELEYIYIKYKETVEKFAETYNEKYPQRKLKQINVGM